MVVCLIALPVFAVLGLFSAKYRYYAKQAFECTFKKVTLRPCDLEFDRKIKQMITRKLIRVNKPLAGFVFRNFNALSYAFTALFFVSLILTGYGVFNFIVYGNCNGPHSDEFCVFNPTASLNCGSQHCDANGCDCGPKDTNCTAENNYAACDSNCDCSTEVCG